jgi:ABC-2 type transport system ATP-binding protein
MCDRIGIINQGRLIAAGTMDELRQLPQDRRDDIGQGESRLEDIFLTLTGGAEYAEIADVLK